MPGETAPIIDIGSKSFRSDGSTGGTAVNIYELEIAAINQINILNNQISNYMKNPSDDQLVKIKKQVNVVNTAYTVLNKALQKSTKISYNTVQPGENISLIQNIQNDWNKIKNMRNDIDLKLTELSKTDKSKFVMDEQRYDASIYEKILWTALATSMIYYAFLHL
jgi:hypothetical protein